MNVVVKMVKISQNVSFLNKKVEKMEETTHAKGKKCLRLILIIGLIEVKETFHLFFKNSDTDLSRIEKAIFLSSKTTSHESIFVPKFCQ